MVGIIGEAYETLRKGLADPHVGTIRDSVEACYTCYSCLKPGVGRARVVLQHGEHGTLDLFYFHHACHLRLLRERFPSLPDASSLVETEEECL